MCVCWVRSASDFLVTSSLLITRLTLPLSLTISLFHSPTSQAESAAELAKRGAEAKSLRSRLELLKTELEGAKRVDKTLKLQADEVGGACYGYWVIRNSSNSKWPGMSGCMHEHLLDTMW